MSNLTPHPSLPSSVPPSPQGEGRNQTLDVKASSFDEIIRLPCVKGAGTTVGRD